MIQEAANKLGFWNPFGRSYKIPNNDQYVAEPPSPADSDDDDNNMEASNYDRPNENMDELPEQKPKPVPFGHIFRDGIDDPGFGYKVPYDMLELDMRFPLTKQEQEREIRERPKNKLVKILKSNKNFLSPRDAYMDEFLKKEDNQVNTKNATVEDDQPKWFNFEKIQNQNAKAVVLPDIHPKMRTDNIETKKSDISISEKISHFSRNTFELPEITKAGMPNWTTCEEFEKTLRSDNVVYPKDIVDIEWEPFYVWSLRKNIVAHVHRFSYPTKKIVREYRGLYEKFLPKYIDWEEPKLILQEQMEMLLIAGDRKGLFYGIPRQELPLSMRHKKITLTPIILRLKIEDPYLALMFCNDLYAIIMASKENLPMTVKEKTEEAALLKFKGEGYPISRNKHKEKLKLKAIEEQKQNAEARKFIKALPGYPGIDDILSEPGVFLTMLQSVAKYIVFLVIIFVLITRVSGGSGQFPDGLRNATTCAEFSTKKSPKIAPMDVRFKQINNGKYIAYMECQRETVFLMSRKEDIPSKKHIQDEAARAGFRSRGGKSYLYQGHQWMPIPEDDEESFWMTPEERKKEIDRLEMMRKYARPKKQ
ncbi:unnamed protein product [Diatraea saccharalis]|uniref:Uncharacterized protein n=1 Tax=Diatraea saccharalis TaxID=40085 RepID=A0A9N9R8J5_9NEOP|nr:unnamed protein product [Diatraea saccharalis]